MPPLTTVLLVVERPREVLNRPKIGGGEVALVPRFHSTVKTQSKEILKWKQSKTKKKKKDFVFYKTLKPIICIKPKYLGKFISIKNF